MADVSKIKLPDNTTVNIKDSRVTGIDSTPTASSTNLVTSGGVYSAEVWEAGAGTTSVKVKSGLGTAGGNFSTVEGKGSVTGGTHSSYDLTPDTADTTAGSYAHAEGRYTIACGAQGSHAEGDRTLASGKQSHAEGLQAVASGNQSHAEGAQTTASGSYSHAEGGLTKATAGGSHAEGLYSIASGTYSHAEGQSTEASGRNSHSEGYASLAIGNQSHAEGYIGVSIGSSSHAEGYSVAYGNQSHSESANKGVDVFPVGAAEATSYTSTFDSEFDSVRSAIGDTIFCNILKSSYIVKKNESGFVPILVTDASLSGTTLSFTTASTLSDTALDGSVNYWINWSVAYGSTSHSENSGNVSYGTNTHAEGNYSVALGVDSHVEGNHNVTRNVSEHAEGSYNVSTKTSDTYGNAGNTQHSIGIGTSSGRKNAIEVMQNGDAYLYGVGSYDGTNYSSASTLQSVINNAGGGDTNVIETVKVNGSALTPDANKAVDVTVPVTDVTVGGTSVVSSGTAVIPSIPTVPTNVSSFTNDANYVKYVLCADEAAYNAITTKDSGTLYLIPESSS